MCMDSLLLNLHLLPSGLKVKKAWQAERKRRGTTPQTPATLPEASQLPCSSPSWLLTSLP